MESPDFESKLELKKVESSLTQKAFWAVFILAFLIFFAQTRSFLLLIDGLTYSAVAKNILRTGDWKVFHYDIEHYPEFYQHPPLAFWIQALIYKLLGWAEPVARIFPSACGVLTVLTVFWFTRIRYSLTAAFYASIALISSTRFVKWGSNFYFDVIFTFFCFASFTLWLSVLSMPRHENALERVERRIRFWSLLGSFLAGVLFSFSLLTKGVIGASIGALSFFALILFASRRAVTLFFIYLLGLALPFLLWIQFGNGLDFLHKYFVISVAGRVQAHEWNIHPWRNIYKLWWPWWPILVVAFATTLRKMRVWRAGDLRSGVEVRLEACLFLAAISFPIGFSFGVGYLEHYITPFYPFASVLVGVQLARWVRPVGQATIKSAFGLAFAIAIFLATVAPNVNEQKDVPATQWVREIRTLPEAAQKQIKLLMFTERAGDLWINLATILGRTDWQSIGNYALDRSAAPHSILIAKKGESVSSTWSRLPCMFLEEYDFYSPQGEPFCP